MSNYEDWQETTGLGPCGAVAVVLRERGFGKIAVCEYDLRDGSCPFPHYVIVQPSGNILDTTNPFTGGQYRDVEVLDDTEWPDCIGEGEAQYWRDLLAS
jgi:hypothetical protein